MKSNLFKTITILIAVIFIPILFFTVYEISTLNSSEQVLDKIYSNQLDAILFSVNQYSEDVISSWRNKINNSVVGNNDKLIGDFLKAYNPVSYVFIADSVKGEDLKVFSDRVNAQEEKVSALNILHQKVDILNRLYVYKKGGYLKLEPVQV